jgi:hypothetical protein
MGNANLGTIKIEETGLTNGHPAVIISGKIKPGTACKTNGLLMLDESTGQFTAYDFTPPGIVVDDTTIPVNSGAAYIALEPIPSAETITYARVLLHGTFNRDQVIKADGSALSPAELAAVQKRSQIYFV